jgi:carboxymethylenebutenolidase
MMTTVDLPTPDGACKTNLFTPDTGAGPWPGVIFAMDGVGPRQALDEMAQRISNFGYVVALPDLYFRVGSVLDALPPGTPRETKSFYTSFANAAFRDAFRVKYAASATNTAHLTATVNAVLELFATRTSVKAGPIGTTGYCLGGNVALRIAGLFGSRVAAAASFHGGGLATPAPDSPHLLAPAVKATTYFGCAVEDSSCTDEMKALLDDALTKAQVAHTIETYHGAKHGFCVHDSPVFNHEAAERHYGVVQALFARSL